MNQLQKLLNQAEENLNDTETEQAPSGEWAEYNINYLQKESYLEGIQAAADIVGTCNECMFYHTLGCKTQKPNWYCPDFGIKDINDNR